MTSKGFKLHICPNYADIKNNMEMLFIVILALT